MKTEAKLRQIVEKSLKTNIDQSGYYIFESPEVEPTGFCGDEHWISLHHSDSDNIDYRAKSCDTDECYEKVLAMCEEKHENVSSVFLQSSAQPEFDNPERCCHCQAVINAHFTDEFFQDIYLGYFKGFDNGIPNDDDISLYLDSYHFSGLSTNQRVKILLHIIECKMESAYNPLVTSPNEPYSFLPDREPTDEQH